MARRKTQRAAQAVAPEALLQFLMQILASEGPPVDGMVPTPGAGSPDFPGLLGNLDQAFEQIRRERISQYRPDGDAASAAALGDPAIVAAMRQLVADAMQQRAFDRSRGISDAASADALFGVQVPPTTQGMGLGGPAFGGGAADGAGLGAMFGSLPASALSGPTWNALQAAYPMQFPMPTAPSGMPGIPDPTRGVTDYRVRTQNAADIIYGLAEDARRERAEAGVAMGGGVPQAQPPASQSPDAALGAAFSPSLGGAFADPRMLDAIRRQLTGSFATPADIETILREGRGRSRGDTGETSADSAAGAAMFAPGAPGAVQQSSGAGLDSGLGALLSGATGQVAAGAAGFDAMRRRLSMGRSGSSKKRASSANDLLLQQMRGAQTPAPRPTQSAPPGSAALGSMLGQPTADSNSIAAAIYAGMASNVDAQDVAFGGGIGNLLQQQQQQQQQRALTAALASDYRRQLAALAASVGRAQTTGTQAADAAASAMRANPSPYQNLQLQRMGDVSNPLMNYMRALGTSTQQVDATTGLLNEMNRTQNAGMDQLVGNLNTINQNAMSGALNDVERSKQAFVQRLADQRAEEELALQRYYGTRGVRV